MLIDDNVREKVREAAFEHLFHVMGNKSLFMEPDNFSTVQYMNEKSQINLLKFKEVFLRKLYKLNRNNVYLNIGTGGGHLEYVNRLMGDKIHITTVEWEKQYECFSKIRETLEIKVDYLCNNVLEKGFEINECKTRYDFMILERFFPIYGTMDKERIEFVLRQLAPYANKALIVDSESNWSKKQREYLDSIVNSRFHLADDWKCRSIRLDQFR